MSSELQSRTKKQIDNFTQTIVNLNLSSTSNKSIQTENQLSTVVHAVSKRDMVTQTQTLIEHVSSTRAEKIDPVVSSKTQGKPNNLDFFQNLEIQETDNADNNSSNNFVRGNKSDFKSTKKVNDTFRNRKLMYNESAEQLNDFLNKDCDDNLSSKSSKF